MKYTLFDVVGIVGIILIVGTIVYIVTHEKNIRPTTLEQATLEQCQELKCQELGGELLWGICQIRFSN